MQIKQQMLAQQIQVKIAPLYVLIGEDNYLLENSLVCIKSAIKKKHDCDEKIISIQSAEDWNHIREEANNYPLFSDTILLNILFDKKSIDTIGKKFLSEYLDSINSRCFIIIRAPNIPAKQLKWLSTHEHAVISIAYPLNSEAMKNWIAAQLKKNSINFDPQVPDLIHQYTQGNMLASAQVIEKILLSNAPNSIINLQQAQEHLSDQCDYDLFELVEACLLGQGDKAIQILRYAMNNKTEATLVLWILSQEIRTIMQLVCLMEQKIDIKNACQQLKIWPQRINYYQICCNRLHKTLNSSSKNEFEKFGKITGTMQIMLQNLHRYCYSLDEQIKSNLNTQVWNSLENIALSLCLGQLIGDTCTI